jgi:hypothetical protein
MFPRPVIVRSWASAPDGGVTYTAVGIARLTLDHTGQALQIDVLVVNTAGEMLTVQAADLDMSLFKSLAMEDLK